MSEETPWYRTGRGKVVVIVYGVLTVVAILASTGRGPTAAIFVNASATGSSGAIPPQVYLYGFLGAMAYAFTSIVAKIERGVTGLLKVGLRALAALPLAAGVFLLAGAMNVDASSGKLVAGLAFIVGLYVNLTLKALGGLAKRLYEPLGSGDSGDR